jgi:hypothetical protein
MSYQKSTLQKPDAQFLATADIINEQTIANASIWNVDPEQQSEHDQPTGTVGPKKYHAFMLRWKFEGDAEYKTVTSTRLHHTLLFEQADETKRVILAAAWVNPHLQPGLWSNDVTEVIGQTGSKIKLHYFTN